MVYSAGSLDYGRGIIHGGDFGFDSVAMCYNAIMAMLLSTIQHTLMEQQNLICVCVNSASTALSLCHDRVSTHRPVLSAPLGTVVNKD